MAGLVGTAFDLGRLFLLSDARSRAVSPENPSGAKGQGGVATDGTGADLARDLGPGWKISPPVHVPPRATAVLADIEGPGVIRRVWLTLKLMVAGKG
jgi:hypothetical protein